MQLNIACLENWLKYLVFIGLSGPCLSNQIIEGYNDLFTFPEYILVALYCTKKFK